MSQFESIQPYPEWRQLVAKIQPLLAEGKREYSYPELKELSGIDVLSERGRAQFYKFRKHAQREWNVWFECNPKFGYVVIPAHEHPKAAVKRVSAARRKIRLARSINTYTKVEELNSDQLVVFAQTGALIDELGRVFGNFGRKLQAVAVKHKLTISEEDLEALTTEPVRKKIPAGVP